MSGGSKQKQGKDTPTKAAGKSANNKPQLSASQLRNARKRRSKQKQYQPLSSGKDLKKSSISQKPSSTSDPSAQYLDRPHWAPLVKAAKQFFAGHLPSFPIYQNGPKTGWRTVSKLPVRKDPQNKVVIGMFQPQTHTIAAANNHNTNEMYPAHHPSINSGITALTQACRELNIQPYDETNGTGYLRYVAMNVERSTGHVQLTLIWKDDPYRNVDMTKQKGKKRKRKASDDNTQTISEGQLQLERLLSHLVKAYYGTSSEPNKAAQSSLPLKHEFQLHSLWVHYNAAWKHSNAIFDIQASEASWQHFVGPKTIAEQVTTLITNQRMPYQPTLHFAPNVFRQANLDAFAHIVSAIRKRLQQHPFLQQQQQKSGQQSPLPKVLELYGGVGTIGLHLLDLVSSCLCSDENPYNRACFQSSLDGLSQDYSSKATYVPQNATDMVTDRRRFLQQDCQVVIVDPPRKGLEDAVVEALLANTNNHNHNNKVELLIYVSCGFDAFQRDFASLTKNQRWKLEHAEGHILFPGANAIETVAFFTPIK